MIQSSAREGPDVQRFSGNTVTNQCLQGFYEFGAVTRPVTNIVTRNNCDCQRQPGKARCQPEGIRCFRASDGEILHQQCVKKLHSRIAPVSSGWRRLGSD